MSWTIWNIISQGKYDEYVFMNQEGESNAILMIIKDGKPNPDFDLPHFRHKSIQGFQTLLRKYLIFLNIMDNKIL